VLSAPDPKTFNTEGAEETEDRKQRQQAIGHSRKIKGKSKNNSKTNPEEPEKIHQKTFQVAIESSIQTGFWL
jgi:hypothetical protein